MKLNRKCILSFTLLSFYLAGCNGSNTGDDLGKQFDRMGIAGINTVFIPSGEKDGFNLGQPSLDSVDYGQTIVNTTNALRAAVGSVPGFPPEDLEIPAEGVRDIVIPDVVTLDLSAPDGFPNGRKLDDDVIDTALQVTLNRSIVGDGISNDSAFFNVFPYLGTPN